LLEDLTHAASSANRPRAEGRERSRVIEEYFMKARTKISAVLMVCYLVAWLDRMAINMAMPFMSKDLDFGPDKIGWVLSAFFAGYALFQIPGGILSDRIGPRAVICFALAWWSVFTGLTGVASSFAVLLVVRFLFGVGEGLFPAAVWKVIGQFFTRKNRATANALVLSSIAIGPALTPLALRPILATWGWRVAFYALGLVGLSTFALARRFIFDSPAQHPMMSAGELSQFESDARVDAKDEGATTGQASYRDLFSSPVVWALFCTALAGNITMYGWLNWLPSYLMKVKGLDLKGMALAASLPFAFGAVGCMLSGWVSDRWFRGRRKVLVLCCQLLGGLALFGFTQVADVGRFMVLQCAAGFLLFMSVGAIWAMPMVLLPTRLMGSGSGFINMGGQIGGFLTNIIIGYVITLSGGDYASGFNVLFGGLVLSATSILIGVREAPVPPRTTLPRPQLT
jgi:sugar phosphate permease